MFWPRESKSDVHFCWPNRKPSIIRKISFSGLSKVYGGKTKFSGLLKALSESHPNLPQGIPVAVSDILNNPEKMFFSDYRSFSVIANLNLSDLNSVGQNTQSLSFEPYLCYGRLIARSTFERGYQRAASSISSIYTLQK